MAFADPEKGRQYAREYYHRVRKKTILSPEEKTAENVKRLNTLPMTKDGTRFLYYWEVEGYVEGIT